MVPASAHIAFTVVRTPLTRHTPPISAAEAAESAATAAFAVIVTGSAILTTVIPAIRAIAAAVAVARVAGTAIRTTLAGIAGQRLELMAAASAFRAIVHNRFRRGNRHVGNRTVHSAGRARGARGTGNARCTGHRSLLQASVRLTLERYYFKSRPMSRPFVVTGSVRYRVVLRSWS